MLRLALVIVVGHFVEVFGGTFFAQLGKLTLCQARINGQETEPCQLEFGGVHTMVAQLARTQVPEHVVEVGAHPGTKQGIAAAFVNHLALAVHHVVVFQQALAHGRSCFLRPCVCALVIDLVIIECWITSPSLIPRRSMILEMRSEPKRRIRSSSRET
jgi:hypothetical protein